MLAALANAGYSAQEARAYYGQMLASGQIGRNGIVQPGRELNFVEGDYSQARQVGRTIAAEECGSGGSGGTGCSASSL